MKKFLALLLLFPALAFAAEDKAYQMYKQAEEATNTEARKKAFNDALTLYLQEETANATSTLYYNIANTYYQLHEYGYAILYYYKALKEDPRNDLATVNLQVTLQKTGLPTDTLNSVQSTLFFFHYKLSHNEKAITIIMLLLIAFGFFSIHIWMPQQAFKKIGIYCLWATLPFLGSILWLDDFSPPQAVVVRPVVLRRDAGEQYAAIQAEPALPGMKVRVITVTADGNWMLVRLPSGVEGYLSKEYARLI